MIDFDIDGIREVIKDLPYEDKLAFLEDKEMELNEELEAIELLLSDISFIKDDIRTEKNDKMCKQVLQSLKDNGYDMDLDSNGNLTFPLGLVDIIISMQFLDTKVDFSFKASQKQLTICELISSILPEFKVDGNYFSQEVQEEEICKCVVDVVDTLMNHKERFLNI